MIYLQKNVKYIILDNKVRGEIRTLKTLTN